MAADTKSAPEIQLVPTNPNAYTAMDTLIASIYRQAASGGRKYKYLIAVVRGGLPVSYEIRTALHSDEWPVSIVTLNVASRAGDHSQKELMWFDVPGWTPEKIDNPEDYLLVDEINDSGYTLREILKRYPGIDTAAMDARYQDHGLTHVGRVIGNEKWQFYDWENRTRPDGTFMPRPWEEHKWVYGQTAPQL